MRQQFDLANTFVHLRDGGDAERVELTPAFWRQSSPGKKKHDRIVGVFEFKSAGDLHSSMQEMHPEADEVLYLVAGSVEALVSFAVAQGGRPQSRRPSGPTPPSVGGLR